MRELWLIRHGQASFGAEDYDQLSPVGEEQSRLLGGWLADCGIKPDLVAIGPRARHRDTATHCLQAAGIETHPLLLPGLDEVDHHELLTRLRPDLTDPGALRAEMKRSRDPHRTFQQLFTDAIARWMSGEHHDDYHLSWSTFRANVLEAQRQLLDHSARTVLAFTSGGPIAVMTGAWLGTPLPHTFELAWPLVNTGVTRLRLSSRGATLMTYNMWPHLERAGNDALVTMR
jgi:broad specificity phosphatase PhoE